MAPFKPVLSIEEANAVLLACGNRNRKEQLRLTSNYQRQKTKQALELVLEWKKKNVPLDIFKQLMLHDKRLVIKLGLKCISPAEQTYERVDDACSTVRTENPIVPLIQVTQNCDSHKATFDKVEEMNLHVEQDITQFVFYEPGHCSDPLEMMPVKCNKRSIITYSFKTILQHWAVVTNKKKQHLTLLLKLLKHHKPNIDFDSLPSTGARLIDASGVHFQTNSNDTESKNTELENHYPKFSGTVIENVTFERGNGKILYFGLETALLGESFAAYTKNGFLAQFFPSYLKDPSLLPLSIQKKHTIEQQASDVLHGISSPDCKPLLPSCPHFKIDFNADGVQVFNNTENTEFIPLLGTIHSIAKDFHADEADVMQRSEPFIIGVYQGTCKPPPKILVERLVQEFKRLHPSNKDVNDREFTAELHCIRADGPMRSYLKRTKGHSGYFSCDRCVQKGVRVTLHKKKKKGNSVKIIQLRQIAAKRRTDQHFLSYYAHDGCEDNHIPNIDDLSPFIELNLPMVSGFAICSMHTMHGGAFLRRLEGLAVVPSEGKLSAELLLLVDHRLSLIKMCKPSEFDRFVRSLSNCASKYKHHELRQFLYYLLFPVFSGVLTDENLGHILLLQQSMLLMGGFDPRPVPLENIDKASELLKQYVKKMRELGFPIRFTTHQIIHLPEDVKKYGCGIEFLSAFVYENFQAFFRKALRSGNLPLEQIRNRLYEFSTYRLSTNKDGLLLSPEELLQGAIENHSCSKEELCVKEYVSKRQGTYKMIKFTQFTLTNNFPNNCVLLKNNNAFVCTDIIKNATKENCFSVIGHRFTSMKDCYSNPIPSSKFSIFIGEKLCPRSETWNVNNISAKVYAIPLEISKTDKDLPNIITSDRKWYLSPIFHTLNMSVPHYTT